MPYPDDDEFMESPLPNLAEWASSARAVLDELDWSVPLASEEGARWIQDRIDPDEILTSLAALEPSSKRIMAYNCRETGTHHKWLLFSGSYVPYRIWLHQFKSEISEGAGFSTAPHNHRYAFSTLILRGGYQHDRYEEFPSNSHAVKRSSRPVGVGDTYYLECDDIHSLANIMIGTLTLIIQSPPTRSESSSVLGGSRRVHRTPFAICSDRSWPATRGNHHGYSDG